MRAIEEYDLFKKAHELNVKLAEMIEKSSGEMSFLIAEALRLGTGINIALIEGAYTGKGSFRPALDRAFAKGAGVRYFINLMTESSLLNDKEGKRYEEEAVNICKMISGLRNKIDEESQNVE